MEIADESPLSIYIHVPFCARKCAYCDFLSHVPSSGEIVVYFESLLEEIRSWSWLLGRRRIRSIFFGGGTPSFVPGEYITACLEEIGKQSGCMFADVADSGSMSVHYLPEITLEANPGTFGEEKLRLWRQAGISRLSIGLQSADDKELARLGRIHNWKMFEENYLLARRCGFNNINIDLMSALPGQTTESWRRTLEKVLALRPEHISAYSLIIEEGTPFYELYGDPEVAAGPSVSADSVGATSISDKIAAGPSVSADSVNGTLASDKIASGTFTSVGTAVVGAVCSSNIMPAPLPSEEDERRMYHFTKTMLKQHGYERYEISNYSLPGYECRHNIVYWTGGDYLGIGIGASSYIEGRRFRAPRNMDEYRRYATSVKKLDRYEKQSKREAMEEFMFLGLRMTKGISVEDFNRRFASDEQDGLSWKRPNEGGARYLESSYDGLDLFSKLYGDIVERYISMGILKNAGGRIWFTDEGIDVSNKVLADFLIEEE